MTLNQFKDTLFDVLNESEELDLADLQADDENNTFCVTTRDGSRFPLACQRNRDGEMR